MGKFKWIFLIFALSCSELSTIGIKRHQFNLNPKKIIWIQLAGFSAEHLAMLRFGGANSAEPTTLERMTCYGELWNYNLFNLRPLPYQGLLAQINGRQNIKGTCEDFEATPVWARFQNLEYKVGIFEKPIEEKNSITESNKCSGSKYLKGVHFWKMGKSSSTDTFHYLDKKEFVPDKIYYDRSCQKNNCDTGIYNNVKSVYTQFNTRDSSNFFLIRDFSYLYSLQNKNLTKAREILAEISSIVDFLKKANQGENFLIILSSASAFSFEYPNSGNNWASFEQKGDKVIYRRSNLSSPVMALGAGAENFCGIYEQWEMHPRMFWRPPKNVVPILDSDIELETFQR